jgi:ATP adenylyltransferase
MEYIRSAQHDVEGCFLCDEPAAGDDDRYFILARGDTAYVVLNIYPYNPGHLLVAPYRHTAALEDLDDAETLDMSRLLQRSIAALKAGMEPHGFNLGMNLSHMAGAGIPDHVHWHVVPRWGGDTNFMPIVSDTRVLPELLEETYVRLKTLF